MFKRYVPLCKRVAEAGWEPIPLAHSSDPHVYVERFGRRYLTVFNDSRVPHEVTVTLDASLRPTSASRELLSGKRIVWDARGAAKLALSYEDVAVIDLKGERSEVR